MTTFLEKISFTSDPELAILASIIHYPERYHAAAEIVRETDFEDELHRQAWQAISFLAAANEPIDAVTVGEHMEGRGANVFRSTEFLLNVWGLFPFYRNVKKYADILARRAGRKNLVERVVSMAEKLKGGLPEDEAVAELKEAIDETDRKTSVIASSKDVVVESLELVEQMVDKKIGGYSYPLAGLNEYTGGAFRGDSIIVAGLPSLGKSSLMDMMLLSFARPALLVDLDTTKTRFVLRRLMRKANVTKSQLIRGDGSEVGRIIAAASEVEKYPLWIDDKTHDIDQIISLTHRAKQEFGIEVMALDYIQLVSVKSKANETRNQQLSYASNALKNLAKELEIVVVIVSQLSRLSAKENRRPRLDDLRDSGSLEQDADLVLMLWGAMDEATKTISDERELLIKKNRDGRTGRIEVSFDGPRFLFSEPANDYDERWYQR